MFVGEVLVGAGSVGDVNDEAGNGAPEAEVGAGVDGGAGREVGLEEVRDGVQKGNTVLGHGTKRTAGVVVDGEDNVWSGWDGLVGAANVGGDEFAGRGRQGDAIKLVWRGRVALKHVAGICLGGRSGEGGRIWMDGVDGEVIEGAEKDKDAIGGRDSVCVVRRDDAHFVEV